jgi:hypothetical protein
MTDHTTKWVEAEPVRDLRAETLTSAFLRAWVSRFGVPSLLVTDGAFASEIVYQLNMILGVTHLVSTPYHPQGNAPVEQWHRHLVKHLGDVKSRWPTLSLPEITALTLLAYRSQLHTSLGDTPARFLYGMDILFPPERLVYSALYDINKERGLFLNSLRDKLVASMTEAAQAALRKANRGRKDATLEYGDLVLVRRRDPTKMGGAWSLPRRIVATLSQGKAGLAQDLLTKAINHVHIEDTRPLPRPQGRVQLHEWYHHFWHEGYQGSLEDFKVLLIKPEPPSSFPLAPTHDPPAPPRYAPRHTLPPQPIKPLPDVTPDDPESEVDDIWVDLDQIYVDRRPRTPHYRLTATGLLPCERKVYWADELLPRQPLVSGSA